MDHPCFAKPTSFMMEMIFNKKFVSKVRKGIVLDTTAGNIISNILDPEQDENEQLSEAIRNILDNYI
jgi:hypothetical protein